MIGGVVSRLVNGSAEDNGIRLLVEPTGGSVEIIDRLESGDLAFGVAQADIEFAAVEGSGPWEEAGERSSLRAVCSLHEELVTLVANGASGIARVADLAGKRVDLGPPGSGTRANALMVLADAGLDPDLDLETSAFGVEDTARLLAAGALDALFYTTGHPSRLIAGATVGAYFVPVTLNDEIFAANPYLLRSRIPAHLYLDATNSEDIETVGTRAVLLTSARISDRVVETVARSLIDNVRQVRDMHPGLSRLRPDGMSSGFSAPLHLGAARYLEEAVERGAAMQ